LPHVNFIAEFGLDHIDESLSAQYELTQRFTAEFSIRAFIERHETRTLAVLETWTKDPNEHVRRLVSEGTRPRLPWARRLSRYQADPTPVLALLERLKDDPSEYVRRSVANNLNDIGKDNPALLVSTAKRWMRRADDNRRALVRHALRSLVKSGDRDALSILGFGHASGVRLVSITATPKRVVIGEKVVIDIALRNPGKSEARVLADLRVHFVKADGSRRPKVFKGNTLIIPRGTTTRLRKTVSLAELTTRRHYPGRHAIDLLLNGKVKRGTEFLVIRRAAPRGRRV
jgi:3-methyladenine DNA glycosylase AlkC